MARPIRIEYENALYHIMARGILRTKVFAAPAEKRLFLEILGEIKKAYGLIIHGYCLMDNHYHLQIETPQANMIKAMKRIQENYSIKYNAKQKRRGHVFEGRYKAYLVDKENYLLEVSRYIHLNPVKAGIARTPEEYEWSSYREYIGTRKEGVTNKDWILERFSRFKRKAMREYRRFVMDKVKDEKYDPLEAAYGGYILGGESFVNWVKDKYSCKQEEEGISERRYIKPRISKETIIGKVRERIPEAPKEQRKVIVYLLRKYTDMPLKKVAAEYGKVHYSALTQMLRRNGEMLASDKRVIAIERELEAI